MQQKGPHKQDSASLDRAHDGWRLLDELFDGASVKAAMFMRTRNDTQRSVFLLGIIEMHAYGKHSCQDFRRWLHVDNSGLH